MYADVFAAELPPKLRDLKVLTKAGVRGAPGVDDAQALLARVVRDEGVRDPVLDLHAMSGVLGCAVEGPVTLAEGSCAALTALRAQFPQGAVHAAAPGDDLGRHGTVAVVLSGDRGTAFVEAQVAWAAACLAPGGTLFVAGDKQKGFERYFKAARAALGEGEIVARDGGMRVGVITRSGEAADLSVPGVSAYELDGLQVRALPGVFSSGGLDRASRLLLGHLADVSGRRVLDLGCGAGVLGGAAAARGAAATLLDDDLSAVRSSRLTLNASGLAGDVRHSDVTSALSADETFDLVISNPPFHVGRRVVLDVAQEFVAAAGRHLVRGGEMRLVANDFLPYEAPLAAWGEVSTLAREGGFKVLRAVKR